MFEKFIGQKCKAVILFGDDSAMNSRAIPARIYGVLDSCDETCICLKTKEGYSIIPIKTLLYFNVIE